MKTYYIRVPIPHGKEAGGLCVINLATPVQYATCIIQAYLHSRLDGKHAVVVTLETTPTM